MGLFYRTVLYGLPYLFKILLFFMHIFFCFAVFFQIEVSLKSLNSVVLFLCILNLL